MVVMQLPVHAIGFALNGNTYNLKGKQNHHNLLLASSNIQA